MLYGSLEAGIDRNASGWRCRQSLILNIGGAKTCARVSSRRSVICSVRHWSVFRVEECVDVVSQPYQKHSRKCKLASKIDWQVTSKHITKHKWERAQQFFRWGASPVRNASAKKCYPYCSTRLLLIKTFYTGIGYYDHRSTNLSQNLSSTLL